MRLVSVGNHNLWYATEAHIARDAEALREDADSQPLHAPRERASVVGQTRGHIGLAGIQAVAPGQIFARTGERAGGSG